MRLPVRFLISALVALGVTTSVWSALSVALAEQADDVVGEFVEVQTDAVAKPADAAAEEPAAEAAPQDGALYGMADSYGPWTRLWGQDALGTMQAVVRAGFSGQGGTVVVATCEGYWDALAASGIAGLEGAPVVITRGDSLAEEARAELARLAPSRVLVMGGELAVSPACFEQVRELCPGGTERVWGRDATATAVEIFRAGAGRWGDTAVVATSNGYWDALAIAPFAYSRSVPIFLTTWSSDSNGRVLSDAALAAIQEGGFDRVVIVGGGLAVAESVEGQLSGLGLGGDAVRRLAGQDAIETCAKVARWELDSEGMSLDHLSVASSNGHWDALTGAPLSGSQDSVVVLVSPTGDYRALDAVYSYSGEVEAGYVFGGPLAVTEESWGRIVSPWVILSFQPDSEGEVKLGTPVTLKTVVAGAPEDLDYSYSWGLKYGGGTGETFGGNTLTFDPTRVGTYVITVVVSDAEGRSSSASLELKVKGERNPKVDELLAVASADIGYYVGNDPERGSKFGRWYEANVDRNNSIWDYGEDGVEYCAMAVSYWCDKAGVRASGLPRAGCYGIYYAAKDEGTFVERTKLEPGMLVLFDWDGDALPDHVGIIEERLDEKTYQTIEGNTARGIGGSQDNGGWVARRQRDISNIIGGVAPYFE